MKQQGKQKENAPHVRVVAPGHSEQSTSTLSLPGSCGNTTMAVCTVLNVSLPLL